MACFFVATKWLWLNYLRCKKRFMPINWGRMSVEKLIPQLFWQPRNKQNSYCNK
jgi:hypothetical protein